MSNTSLLGSFGGQAGDALMFRNRIINGCMRIDQRNAGAAISTSGVFAYPVDRFRIKNDLANGTTQRSTTTPTGFTNSLVFTTGTGASPAAANACTVGQAVEGFNIADLGWGTAAAQTVTVSFWARSSLTGTFAFRIGNGVRSYVATYTINSANTFELKTIIIPGDTSGTWATDNSAGMYLNWDLGSGNNLSAASAGSWLAGDFLRVSGTVNVVGTNGATFYLTGVQLEAGPTATPFERRPIGVELSMAQRYYERWSFTAPFMQIASGTGYGGGFVGFFIKFNTQKRVPPTSYSATPNGFDVYVGATSITGLSIGEMYMPNVNSARLRLDGTGVTNAAACLVSSTNSSNVYFDFNAEL